MSRVQARHEFYIDGVDSGKQKTFLFEVKRPPSEKIAQFDKSKSKEIIEWVDTCERVFYAWKKEILESL